MGTTNLGLFHSTVLSPPLPPLSPKVCEKKGKCVKKDKCHCQGLGADDKGMMVTIHLSPGATQPAVHTILGDQPKG